MDGKEYSRIVKSVSMKRSALSKRAVSLFSLLTLLAATSIQAENDPIDIGQNLELFLDYYLIAEMKGKRSGNYLVAESRSKW